MKVVVSYYIIACHNTFQVRTRENEAAKQVILAVSCTEQKDRKRIHTNGNQIF